MIINHNMSALNAKRKYNVNVNNKQINTERLSSGYRINRAADDAAGLAISEKMRAGIRGLTRASKNIQDGINYVQTADGALNECHSILQRMRELAVQASNDTNTDFDRECINMEYECVMEELDRIFESTEYNTIKIWKDNVKPIKLTGYRMEQSVKNNTNYTSFPITQSNRDVVAGPAGYDIHASTTDGVYVSWTGADGNNYQTDKMSWNDFVANNYTFKMSDLYGVNNGSNPLYNADGTPKFDKTISFNPIKEASPAEIVASIDGTNMYSSPYINVNSQFEMPDGSVVNYNGISTSVYIDYGAAYASNINMDASDDSFITPANNTYNLTKIPAANTSDISVASASTDCWEFEFDLDGVGKVKAKSTNISISSPDRNKETENIWWQWYKRYDGVMEKTGLSYSFDGSLGSFMDALVGDRASGSPGILSTDNGGATENGGYATILFDLVSDNNYAYAGNNSNNVGSMYVNFYLNKTDTQQTILDKINAAFNSTTIMDFQTDYPQPATESMGSGYVNYVQTKVPVYSKQASIMLQVGANANQTLEVTYDAYDSYSLGLNNTDLLQHNNCQTALNRLDDAISMVSSQRSYFGAVQNRLEHARANNDNTAENLQDAESKIRDTDMAKEIMQSSKNDILIQASQSMIAQSNNNVNNIMNLLNG